MIPVPSNWPVSTQPAVRDRVRWAPNFRTYHAGILAVSGRPHDPDGARQANFTTVITFEPEADAPYLEGRVKTSRLEFFRIPVVDEHAPSDADIGCFLMLLADMRLWPILACCHGGEHRSSTFACAVRLAWDGWDWESTMREAARFDINHGPVPAALVRLWEGGPLSRSQMVWLRDWSARHGLGGLK